jgi:hypothetical protein
MMFRNRREAILIGLLAATLAAQVFDRREAAGRPPEAGLEEDSVREVAVPIGQGVAVEAHECKVIPGTEAALRLHRPARVWVVATWDLLPGGNIPIGQLVVDGERQPRQAIGYGFGRATLSQQYVVFLEAGRHTLALSVSGSNGPVQVWDHTGYSYLVIPEWSG